VHVYMHTCERGDWRRVGVVPVCALGSECEGKLRVECCPPIATPEEGVSAADDSTMIYIISKYRSLPMNNNLSSTQQALEQKNP